MEAVMELRQQLYLTRDGKSQDQYDKRTEIVGRLGLALHACNVHRHFRGQESRVRVVVAGLLQIASDRGFGDRDDAAGFWAKYAGAQFEAFRSSGACASPGLVAGAYAGWDRAALDAGPAGLAPEQLSERAEVQLLYGDFAGAAATLGALVDAASTPGAERRVVILRVAMLYQHALHHHAQAVALIYRLARAGGVSAFNNAELLFLLARAYLDWSRYQTEVGPDLKDGEEPEGAAAAASRLREADALRDTATGLFAKLFHSLETSGLLEDAEAPPASVEAWLDAAGTWRALGDKCAFAGLDLYAADLYEEGARRDPGGAGRAHWYRLAKVQRRCGRHDLALGALNCAIDRSPGDSQLRAVAGAWAAEASADGATKTIDQYVAALPPVVSQSSYAMLSITALVRGLQQRRRVVFKEPEPEPVPPPGDMSTIEEASGDDRSVCTPHTLREDSTQPSDREMLTFLDGYPDESSVETAPEPVVVVAVAVVPAPTPAPSSAGDPSVGDLSLDDVMNDSKGIPKAPALEHDPSRDGHVDTLLDIDDVEKVPEPAPIRPKTPLPDKYYSFAAAPAPSACPAPAPGAAFDEASAHDVTRSQLASAAESRRQSFELLEAQAAMVREQLVAEAAQHATALEAARSERAGDRAAFDRALAAERAEVSALRKELAAARGDLAATLDDLASTRSAAGESSAAAAERRAALEASLEASRSRAAKEERDREATQAALNAEARQHVAEALAERGVLRAVEDAAVAFAIGICDARVTECNRRESLQATHSRSAEGQLEHARVAMRKANRSAKARALARGKVVLSRGVKAADGRHYLVRAVAKAEALELRAFECDTGAARALALTPADWAFMGGPAEMPDPKKDLFALRDLAADLAQLLVLEKGALRLRGAKRKSDAEIGEARQLAEVSADAAVSSASSTVAVIGAARTTLGVELLRCRAEALVYGSQRAGFAAASATFEARLVGAFEETRGNVASALVKKSQKPPLHKFVLEGERLEAIRLDTLAAQDAIAHAVALHKKTAEEYRIVHEAAEAAHRAMEAERARDRARDAELAQLAYESARNLLDLLEEKDAAERERLRLEELAALRPPTPEVARHPYCARPFAARRPAPLPPPQPFGGLPGGLAPSSLPPTAVRRKESLVHFRQLGYVQGLHPYLDEWKALLARHRDAYASPVALRKAVANVRSVHRTLPNDVVFCALAEAGGSVAEARTQLGDKGHLKELIVVSEAVDVDALLAERADGAPRDVPPPRTVAASKSLPSLAATAPGTTPSAPPEAEARLHSSTLSAPTRASPGKAKRTRKHQLGAMSRLADSKHRAIKVNDLGDEIEGLLSDSTDADLLAPTPEPSLKLRKKKKRKEHSPYWIAQDAQHRFRCDVVRLDAWKQGTARDMKIGN